MSRRHRLPQIAAEASYSGWLGCLLGLWTLLGVSTYSSWLQRPMQQMLDHLQPLLPFVSFPQLLPEDPGTSPARIWGAIAALLTTLAFTQMILTLIRGLTLIQGVPPRRRPLWKNRLSALLLTISIMTLAGLACYLAVGSDTPAHGWWTFGSWIGRCWLAWGVLTIAYSLLYHWVSSHLTTPQPIFIGACLASGSNLLGLLSLNWITSLLIPAVATTTTDIGALLGWGILICVDSLIVLVGGALNLAISHRRLQRHLNPPVPPLTTMPPSFESFTIRRRSDR
jgi:MFS family permease